MNNDKTEDNVIHLISQEEMKGISGHNLSNLEWRLVKGDELSEDELKELIYKSGSPLLEIDYGYGEYKNERECTCDFCSNKISAYWNKKNGQGYKLCNRCFYVFLMMFKYNSFINRLFEIYKDKKLLNFKEKENVEFIDKLERINELFKDYDPSSEDLDIVRMDDKIGELIYETNNPLLHINWGYRQYRNMKKNWRCEFCDRAIIREYWGQKFGDTSPNKLCYKCFLKFLLVIEDNLFIMKLFEHVKRFEKIEFDKMLQNRVLG